MIRFESYHNITYTLISQLLYGLWSGREISACHVGTRRVITYLPPFDVMLHRVSLPIDQSNILSHCLPKLHFFFYQNLILTFLPMTLKSIVGELLVTDPHLDPDLNLLVIIS